MEPTTKTKITVSVSVLVGLVLSFFGGVTMLDENVYYCADRGIVMQCDKLSQYVLPNGKCWNEDVGNKICKTGGGWLEIVDNAIFEPQEEPVILNSHIGKVEECGPNGCRFLS